MARPRVIDEVHILRVAREIFCERGAEAQTRDIAEAAGVSQSLLFQRFGTKEALFFAAMIPAPPDIAAIFGQDARSGTGATWLRRVCERLLCWMDEAMPGALRAAMHPRFATVMERSHGDIGAEGLQSALASFLEELQARGSLSQTCC